MALNDPKVDCCGRDAADCDCVIADITPHLKCSCGRLLVRGAEPKVGLSGYHAFHVDDDRIQACLPWQGTRAHEEQACVTCGMDFIVVLTPAQDIEFGQDLERYVRRTVDPLLHSGYQDALGIRDEYYHLIHFYSMHIYIQNRLIPEIVASPTSSVTSAEVN